MCRNPDHPVPAMLRRILRERRYRRTFTPDTEPVIVYRSPELQAWVQENPRPPVRDIDEALAWARQVPSI